MRKITRQESKGLSLAKSTIKEEANLSNQPQIDEANSSFQSNKEKYNMTLTPSRAKRIVGYRTLKYEDLLSHSVDMSKAAEKPAQPSLSKLSNRADPVAKSKFNSKNNSQSSNKSYLLGSGAEINRNEFSQLDISIMSNSRRRVTSKGKRGSGRFASRDQLDMSMAASVREEEDEVRENKDLNTTYIQKTEMVGPKKTVRELGLHVVGKRTKINQYVLVTMIGKGGWGKVFLGIDVNTKQKYVRARSLGSQGHRPQRPARQTDLDPDRRSPATRDQHHEDAEPPQHRASARGARRRSVDEDLPRDGVLLERRSPLARLLESPARAQKQLPGRGAHGRRQDSPAQLHAGQEVLHPSAERTELP